MDSYNYVSNLIHNLTKKYNVICYYTYEEDINFHTIEITPDIVFFRNEDYIREEAIFMYEFKQMFPSEILYLTTPHKYKILKGSYTDLKKLKNELLIIRFKN